MLPDVRLIIAAPFASIMALGCGFGMFAAVHVSQEPLRRMPSAPLQLVAINTASPFTSVVAAAPFDSRAENGEPAGGVSALAYAAPERTEEAAPSVGPNAADREHEASQPAEVSAVAPQAKPYETAAADTGEAAPLSFIVAALQRPPAGPANDAPVPASAQTQPQAPTTEAESAAREAAKVSSLSQAKAPSDPPAKSADKETKETKKTRVAARTRHTRVAHPAGGDAAFEFPNFGAPGNWPTEVAENPAAKRRRATATSSATAESGLGGPFVSAPAR